LGPTRRRASLLPDGTGIWGPSWHLAADRHSFSPVDPSGVEDLNQAQLQNVDFRIFWHCHPGQATRGFAVREDGELVALAAVRPVGDDLWEVGLDVAPGHRGRGLGRVVFSAAGSWSLAHGGLVYSSVSAWNVPSARTQRSVGPIHIFTDMLALPAPFRMPPQPLGRPRPDAELVNYYPDWGVNPDIAAKPVD